MRPQVRYRIGRKPSVVWLHQSTLHLHSGLYRLSTYISFVSFWFSVVSPRCSVDGSDERIEWNEIKKKTQVTRPWRQDKLAVLNKSQKKRRWLSRPRGTVDLSSSSSSYLLIDYYYTCWQRSGGSDFLPLTILFLYPKRKISLSSLQIPAGYRQHLSSVCIEYSIVDECKVCSPFRKKKEVYIHYTIYYTGHTCNGRLRQSLYLHIRRVYFAIRRNRRVVFAV